MQAIKQPSIRDLAVISDKRTCAIADKKGSMVWYCPWRFDQPSLFSLLIDENGGFWSVEAEGKQFKHRRYKGDSAILITDFSVGSGSFSVTDFMPMQSEITGICRIFSPTSVPIKSTLLLKPDYGRLSASLKKLADSKTVLCNSFEFYIKASHPLIVINNTVEMIIPEGESGWMVLLDDKRYLPFVSLESLHKALHQTEEKWNNIMKNLFYEGVYKEQMYQSYKAIQMITHEYSGGILAAGTTSLPEQIGSGRIMIIVMYGFEIQLWW